MWPLFKSLFLVMLIIALHASSPTTATCVMRATMFQEELEASVSKNIPPLQTVHGPQKSLDVKSVNKGMALVMGFAGPTTQLQPAMWKAANIVSEMTLAQLVSQDLMKLMMEEKSHVRLLAIFPIV